MVNPTPGLPPGAVLSSFMLPRICLVTLVLVKALDPPLVFRARPRYETTFPVFFFPFLPPLHCFAVAVRTQFSQAVNPSNTRRPPPELHLELVPVPSLRHRRSFLTPASRRVRRWMFGRRVLPLFRSLGWRRLALLAPDKLR